ncbi:hypothetical protein F5Y15DRAFT_259596 [Xylariaceae sp. FL0016]|nr:hypothetical protein F5Y15DRAFT_259596 [Xylariaceae sp. FL0016]
MVGRTPSLGSLKRGFLPQIHHPLPLNSRESRQLLDSITASFRKNLDQEHPWRHDDTASVSPSNTQKTLSPSNHKERATDRHLRAILLNPLFSHKDDTKPARPLTGAPSHSPFNVFDHAVSKGLMTPRRAAGFLAAVRAQITSEMAQDHSINILEHMARSGAALQVIQWLRASGLENNLNFLADAALVKNLVPFIYAEGLEDVIWNWIAQISMRLPELELQAIPGKVDAKSVQFLLKTIWEANIATGETEKLSLEPSYAAIAKTSTMLPVKNAITARPLLEWWSYLSWTSTVRHEKLISPSAPLFDAFLQVGEPYRMKRNIDFAHLELHHPSHPTHTAAVEYIRRRFQKGRDVAITGLAPRAQKRLAFMAIDTADRLKRLGAADEASWLERLLNTMFENWDLTLLNLKRDESRVLGPSVQ